MINKATQDAVSLAVSFYYTAFDVEAEEKSGNRIWIEMQLIDDILGRGFNTEVLPEVKKMLKEKED